MEGDAKKRGKRDGRRREKKRKKGWKETRKEEAGICPSNTFVPTIFRHTLIFAASRKLAATLLRQCSSGKAKYIEKSLHSLSFVGHIPASSFRCASAKQSENGKTFNVGLFCQFFILASAYSALLRRWHLETSSLSLSLPPL